MKTELSEIPSSGLGFATSIDTHPLQTMMDEVFLGQRADTGPETPFSDCLCAFHSTWKIVFIFLVSKFSCAAFPSLLSFSH